MKSATSGSSHIPNRTLATDPQVILMDEPFAALDAQTREGMQAELLHIQQETRATIVFVTHDIYEASFLGNHVYVLSRLPARIIKYVDARNARDMILKAFNVENVPRAADSLAVERERVRYEPRFLEMQEALREALHSQPNTKS
jgi:ABC-type nitrate/sulfonate/bicarbonate transport system ATPase subunit